MRRQGWRVSISPSPAVIAGSLFSTLLPIMCARITLATALEMRVETLVGGVSE